jgi:hypothetical protein
LPLPSSFTHTPIRGALAKVQGAMCAAGALLSAIHGMPPPGEGHTAFLADVIHAPEPAARGAATSRNECAFRVHGCAESTAIRGIRQLDPSGGGRLLWSPWPMDVVNGRGLLDWVHLPPSALSQVHA